MTWTRAAVLLAFAASVACGGSKSSSNPAGTACSDIFTAMISRDVDCKKMPPALLASEKANPSYLTTRCDDMSKAVAAGRATYDSAKASSCVATLQSVACPSFNPLGAPCGEVFTGKVANGGTCYTDIDCAAGICDSSTSCPGKCVAFLAAGQWCGYPGRVGLCAPDLSCVLDVPLHSGTCQAQAAAGGPCPCQFGNYCDPTTNTCAALKTSGACTYNDECALGYACGGSTCKPIAGVGEACTGVEGATECTYFGTFCDPAARKCKAWPVIGESCAGWPCQSGYCDPDGTVCKDFIAAGAACGITGCNIDSFCTATTATPGGVCQKLKLDGEACAIAQPCLSGNCTGGKCIGPCHEP